jgi:hypothetical protein
MLHLPDLFSAGNRRPPAAAWASIGAGELGRQPTVAGSGGRGWARGISGASVGGGGAGVRGGDSMLGDDGNAMQAVDGGAQ